MPVCSVRLLHVDVMHSVVQASTITRVHVAMVCTSGIKHVLVLSQLGLTEANESAVPVSMFCVVCEHRQYFVHGLLASVHACGCEIYEQLHHTDVAPARCLFLPTPFRGCCAAACIGALRCVAQV